MTFSERLTRRQGPRCKTESTRAVFYTYRFTASVQVTDGRMCRSLPGCWCLHRTGSPYVCILGIRGLVKDVCDAVYEACLHRFGLRVMTAASCFYRTPP